MVDELLVEVLKSYVPVKDYDLHDWETIISRSKPYNKDVTIYPLVYADLYLTNDLEFYDVETKQPDTSFLEDKNYNEDTSLITSVLKSYVPSKDWDLHDWETIISRREEYNGNVTIYPLVYADLYLTNDLEFYDVETKQPDTSFLEDKNYNEIVRLNKQVMKKVY